MDATSRIKEEIYYARKELLKRGFHNADLKIEVSRDLFQELSADSKHYSLTISITGTDMKFEGYEVVVENDAVGFNITHKVQGAP